VERLELDPERPPVPPADLMLRVSPKFAPEHIEPAREAFDLAALEHLRGFERALAVAGRSLTDFERLLDFGCGCGRFIRHLRPLAAAGVEIHGTDIDAEMIEWLQDHVRYASFAVAPHEGPLPYPDGHFDLVINHSVFTHLDERLQDVWLAELRRVSAPGALLALTVHGEAAWAPVAAAAGGSARLAQWEAELERRGILFIRDDAFIGSTHPDFYHSTFHRPWYVFEHWTRFFDLVAYLPQGSDTQDMVLVRRREHEPPAANNGASAAKATGAPASSAPPGAGAVRSAAGRLRYQATRLRRRLQAARRLDPRTVRRELDMLRAGLYEQGNRISVIAAELREQLEQERDEGSD
jgi:SAM-dependent methyltransferase